MTYFPSISAMCGIWNQTALIFGLQRAEKYQKEVSEEPKWV